MLLIPAIDLSDGKCVRLKQGRKSDLTVYGTDPVAIACGFRDSGATMLHVVDLDGAFAGRKSPNRQVAQSIIRAIDIPVQFGGGLRLLSDVDELIGWGASRVVIGTLAVESPENLATLLHVYGSRVCLGIDARHGQVMTRGWVKEETITAVELARRVASAGVERIVFTDVSRDGLLGGVNIEQTCEVAIASGLKVTASGGVSSLGDINALREASSCGIDSVIVGKALYDGRFTLEEALRVASARE